MHRVTARSKSMPQRISFVSGRPAGEVELEGVLALPDRAGDARGLVLCHPHPAGGGCMEVGLLETIEQRATRVGFATLRFDFGGVGGSGGVFTDGLEEPCDVAAACEYMRSLDAVDPSKVSVAGWSFGAWMCLLALAGGLRAASCVAIAPPLGMYDWRPFTGDIAASAAERHYIIGAGDQFCPLDTLAAFTDSISAGDTANTMVLPSTDHFLSGREDMVAELTVEFVESRR